MSNCAGTNVVFDTCAKFIQTKGDYFTKQKE